MPTDEPNKKTDGEKPEPSPAGADDERELDIPIDLEDDTAPEIDLADLDIDLGEEDDSEPPPAGEVYAVDETPAPAGRDPARAAPQSIDRACPNCGAEKTNPKDMVCLRCGYDMKTLKVVKTKTGEVTPDEEVDIPEETEPISGPGRGGFKLPAIVAGSAGGLLLVGYLFGIRGLYPHQAAGPGLDPTITFGDRMHGIWDGLVLVVIWWLCGMGGLLGLAATIGARFGDVRLACIRVLAAVVSMRIITFINLGSAPWERFLEIVGAVGLLLVVATLLFDLKWRDSLIYTFCTMLSFLVLWLIGMFLHGATFGPT